MTDLYLFARCGLRLVLASEEPGAHFGARQPTCIRVTVHIPAWRPVPGESDTMADQDRTEIRYDVTFGGTTQKWMESVESTTGERLRVGNQTRRARLLAAGSILARNRTGLGNRTSHVAASRRMLPTRTRTCASRRQTSSRPWCSHRQQKIWKSTARAKTTHSDAGETAVDGYTSKLEEHESEDAHDSRRGGSDLVRFRRCARAVRAAQDLAGGSV